MLSLPPDDAAAKFAAILLALHSTSPYTFDVPYDTTVLRSIDPQQRSQYFDAIRWEEKRLHDIEEAVAFLKGEESAVARRLLRLRGAASPLHLLPDEILAEIFLLVRDMGVDHHMRSSIPYTLAKVCRQWRGVAVTTPHLWSFLPPQDPHHSAPTVQGHRLYREDLSSTALMRHIERSGTVPLQLFLAVSHHSLRENLPELAPRIQHLTLVIDLVDDLIPPCDFQQLRSVIVRGSRVNELAYDPFTLFATAPQLFSMWMHFNMRYRPNSPTPITTVKQFIGRAPSWTEASLALERLPNVERVAIALSTIKAANFGQAATLPANLDVGLSLCMHLQLCDEATSTLRLPPHMRPTIWTPPNVTRVEISSRMVDLPSDWSRMPHIQHLDIRGALFSHSSLENAITSLPLLRSLYVEYVAGLLPMLHRLLHQNHCHVPSLNVLYVAVGSHFWKMRGDIPMSECNLLREIAETMESRERFQELHFARCMGYPNQFGSLFDDFGWSGWVGIMDDEELVKVCIELGQLAGRLRGTSSTIPSTDSVRCCHPAPSCMPLTNLMIFQVLQSLVEFYSKLDQQYRSINPHVFCRPVGSMTLHRDGDHTEWYNSCSTSPIAALIRRWKCLVGNLSCTRSSFPSRALWKFTGFFLRYMYLATGRRFMKTPSGPLGGAGTPKLLESCTYAETGPSWQSVGPRTPLSYLLTSLTTLDAIIKKEVDLRMHMS